MPIKGQMDFVYKDYNKKNNKWEIVWKTGGNVKYRKELKPKECYGCKYDEIESPSIPNCTFDGEVLWDNNKCLEKVEMLPDNGGK